MVVTSIRVEVVDVLSLVGRSFCPTMIDFFL